MRLLDLLRRILRTDDVRPPWSVLRPLDGRPLRYLIGKDGPSQGNNEEITEVGYGVTAPPARGIGIKYCNLFDQENCGRFGPYLTTSDTAAEDGEGRIDAAGEGFARNLREQFARARKQGFGYVELDNSHAYRVKDVIRAIELAAGCGLGVIAKNPLLMDEDATPCVAHGNVFGVIVEQGAGSPAAMDALRRRAGKPALPVWFVAFGRGKAWALATAKAAAPYRNMGVTYSSQGEYGNAIDIFVPIKGV